MFPTISGYDAWKTRSPDDEALFDETDMGGEDDLEEEENQNSKEEDDGEKADEENKTTEDI